MTASSNQQEQRRRVRPGPILLRILILLDATASMMPIIDGLKKALQGFLDILTQGDLNPDMGLIVFRDELLDEMPEVSPVGTPLEALKDTLARTAAMGGGDEPESSLPAVQRGFSLLAGGRPDARRMMLLLTDAPPHDPENGLTAGSILKTLKQEGVFFFACTPDIEPYRTFTKATGGMLFPLTPEVTADTFTALLAGVAHTTVKTLRFADNAISEDVRALLGQTQLKR